MTSSKYKDLSGTLWRIPLKTFGIPLTLWLYSRSLQPQMYDGAWFQMPHSHWRLRVQSRGCGTRNQYWLLVNILHSFFPSIEIVQGFVITLTGPQIKHIVKVLLPVHISVPAGGQTPGGATASRPIPSLQVSGRGRDVYNIFFDEYKTGPNGGKLTFAAIAQRWISRIEWF